MEILLSTHNRHKITEITAIFSATLPYVKLRTLVDFPSLKPVEEDAPTLEGNAIKKARSGFSETGLLTIADDTGLEVYFLALAPGVYSARYAGEKVSYADNNAKLLRELKGVPPRRRKARFRCAVAVVGKKIEHVVEGSVEGTILELPRGTGGFGYDPLFVPDGFTRSYAELTEEEKNSISHRARAFEKAGKILINK